MIDPADAAEVRAAWQRLRAAFLAPFEPMFERLLGLLVRLTTRRP